MILQSMPVLLMDVPRQWTTSEEIQASLSDSQKWVIKKKLLSRGISFEWIQI